MANLSPASHRSKATKGKGKVLAKTESQVVVEENKERITLYLTNSGANDAWVALEKTAVAEEGIYLKKEGGAATVTDYSGAVGVCTGTGTANIGFCEV
jgi:hypothetical protein